MRTVVDRFRVTELLSDRLADWPIPNHSITTTDRFVPPIESIPRDAPQLKKMLTDIVVARKPFYVKLPVDDILRCLEIFRTVDKAAEKELKVWGWTLIGCLIGGVLSGFLAFGGAAASFAGRSPFLGVLTMLLAGCLPLAAIGIGIYSIIRLYYASQRNVIDQRYQIPERMLSRLRADIFPGRPVELKVDFAPYHDKKFLVKTQKVSYSITRKRFVGNWLMIKGTFVEGTLFRWQQTSAVKQKQKRKPKRTKTSETHSEKYSLTLIPPEHRYPDISAIQAAFHQSSAEPLKPYPLQFPSVSVDNRRITFRVASVPVRSQGTNSNHIYGTGLPGIGLDLFRCSFQALQSCREPAGKR